MNTYGEENELNWSFSGMIGIFLIFTGVGVLLWVAVSLYLLFTDSGAFIFMDEILGAKIAITEAEGTDAILLPRELFLFGIPISALSIGARIGITMLTNGVKLAEKPKKKT
ncbi:MAG: hypothetical protein GY755_02600 [Chloroflexi bacterium]|nr:hypothetical protein [Chloroflexota bacterium]